MWKLGIDTVCVAVLVHQEASGVARAGIKSKVAPRKDGGPDSGALGVSEPAQGAFALDVPLCEIIKINWVSSMRAGVLYQRQSVSLHRPAPIISEMDRLFRAS